MALLPKTDFERQNESINGSRKDELNDLAHLAPFGGDHLAAFQREAALYLEKKHAVASAVCPTPAELLSILNENSNERNGSRETTLPVIASPFSRERPDRFGRFRENAIFIDIDADSYCPSLRDVAERSGILWVEHRFGQLAKIEKLTPRFRDSGAVGASVAIIEDCSEAFGSWRRVGNDLLRAGSLADLSVFSFKPLFGIDGCLLCCDDDSLAERLRAVAVPMDSQRALALRAALRYLDDWAQQRRLLADRYYMLIAENELLRFVSPPVELPGNWHVFSSYVLRARRRDELINFLAECGIEASVPLEPLCELPESLPNAKTALSEAVALPMFVGLTHDEQIRVVAAMAEFYSVF